MTFGRASAARRVDRRRRRCRRRIGFPCHAVRAIRRAVGCARVQRVGRGVGEGRDPRRRRQPEGPPPDVDPAPSARRGGVRIAARPAPARDRFVRERGARRGNPGPGGLVAHRRVRADLDECRPSASGWSRSARGSISASGSATDPPGDPAMFRFREAVESGAVPFTVQGPENALCLDGGRTIGWEIAQQAASTGTRLDRVPRRRSVGERWPHVSVTGSTPAQRPCACIAVQAAGCAPLALRRGERASGARADPPNTGATS